MDAAPKSPALTACPQTSGPATSPASTAAASAAPATAAALAKKSAKELKKERREQQVKQRADKVVQRTNDPTDKARKQSKPTLQPKTVSNAAPADPPAQRRNPLDGDYPSLLAHLSVAKGSTDKAERDVHPAILALGLAYAEHRICGSNARCVALLGAFKRVIRDYQTPPKMHISRHLVSHLSQQISYLVSMRPMSVSMGNAIRYLKYEIPMLDVEMSDEEAKAHIIGRIDSFINERILRADEEIVEHALKKIQDGDVILTFARSSSVQQTLLRAKKEGVRFSVIVVDSRPLLEGRKFLATLNAAGIDCTYTWLNGLNVAMAKATKVLLGAHAMLSNGAMLSRIGSASVALAAHERCVPVLVCCETYKFADRVQTDAFVWNELGRPAALLDTPTPSPLNSMLDNPRLKLLNMTYDITPAMLISIVVTDIGMLPCDSISMVLREYKPMLQH